VHREAVAGGAAPTVKAARWLAGCGFTKHCGTRVDGRGEESMDEEKN
jgi:hypothetical protein